MTAGHDRSLCFQSGGAMADFLMSIFFMWLRSLFDNRLDSLVVECSHRVREVNGSIPDRGRVITKTV